MNSIVSWVSEHSDVAISSTYDEINRSHRVKMRLLSTDRCIEEDISDIQLYAVLGMRMKLNSMYDRLIKEVSC